MTSKNVPAPRTELTGEQYRTVLECIAGRTATLQRMLMLLQGNEIEDTFARSACIDAAEALATVIGAMADEAVGGSVVGDANRWNYGPNFTAMGMEVSRV